MKKSKPGAARQGSVCVWQWRCQFSQPSIWISLHGGGGGLRNSHSLEVHYQDPLEDVNAIRFRPEVADARSSLQGNITCVKAVLNVQTLGEEVLNVMKSGSRRLLASVSGTDVCLETRSLQVSWYLVLSLEKAILSKRDHLIVGLGALWPFRAQETKSLLSSPLPLPWGQ